MSSWYANQMSPSHASILISNSVGKVDSDGDDIVLREFKGYFLEGSRTEVDCKTKMSEFLTQCKQFSDNENIKKNKLLNRMRPMINRPFFFTETQ